MKKSKFYQKILEYDNINLFIEYLNLNPNLLDEKYDNIVKGTLNCKNILNYLLNDTNYKISEQTKQYLLNYKYNIIHDHDLDIPIIILNSTQINERYNILQAIENQLSVNQINILFSKVKINISKKDDLYFLFNLYNRFNISKFNDIIEIFKNPGYINNNETNLFIFEIFINQPKLIHEYCQLFNFKYDLNNILASNAINKITVVTIIENILLDNIINFKSYNDEICNLYLGKLRYVIIPIYIRHLTIFLTKPEFRLNNELSEFIKNNIKIFKENNEFFKQYRNYKLRNLV
jgi:hypothetical protein